MCWASSTEGMGASGAECTIRPRLRGPMLDRQLSSAQRLSRESPRMPWNLYIQQIHTVMLALVDVNLGRSTQRGPISRNEFHKK